MDINTKIGLKTKEMRKNLGLTQNDLAEGIVSRSFISQLEKGKVSPSLDTLEKIAMRLNCTIGTLVDSKEQYNPNSNDLVNILERIEKYIVEMNFDKAIALEVSLSSFEIDSLDRELLSKYLWIKGTIFFEKKEYIDAKIYSLKALESYKLYNEAELVKIYNLLGKVNFKLGEFNEAITFFSKAQYFSQKYSANINLRIETLFNFGVLHAHAKEYMTAIYYLSEAEKLNLNTETLYKMGEIYMALGVCYKNINNLAKSVKQYEKALIYFNLGENNKLYAGVFINLGYLYRKMGDYISSNEYLCKAIDIYIKLNEKTLLVDGEIEIGKNHAFQHEIVAAKSRISKISKYQLNNKQMGLLFFLRGYINILEEKYERGIKLFEESENLLCENENPELLNEIYNEIAILLANYGFYKDASSYFQKAKNKN
ncbi:helix-turn-helix transcriptional regulator [Fictibacillus nanhaiensis]|uniref:Helix-turn-helix transcriptional regulator n=1 Tax=Fictibacillus nanhaiensis TaxID=742169 RepID=A0ABS2ZMF2_9BACL|nr:helix-turn-helix transcriptional regulator [Fictibacillus nanhaiensis]